MITLEQVKEFASTLPGERINPIENGSCVYTGADGSHCIAGEILSYFEFPLPARSDSFNWEVRVGGLRGIREAFSQTAISYMRDLQEYADRYSKRNRQNAWGDAIQEVNRDFMDAPRSSSTK